VNTPHPDLETLAELADRDIAPASETAAPAAAAADPAAADPAAPADPQTAELLAHVAGCAACTADLQALRRVRETLRGLPPVPMPADVAERIEAALLAAKASSAPVAASGVPDTVVPLRRRSKPAGRSGPATSRWRTLPYGAAASIVVVVAVIVVGVVALGHGNNSSKKSAAPAVAAAGTSAASVTIASGTNYTADGLRSQVTSVVTSNVPGAASDFPGLTFGVSEGAAASAAAPAAAAASSAPAAATSAAPTASASAAAAPRPASSPASAPLLPAPSALASAAAGGTDRAAGSSPLSPITAPAGPLADPAALAQCVQILAGKAEQPLLVDYATFNGAPSTIIVLPDPDVAHKLDVYVIADTTNCANQNFTFETFIGPSPSP
jgi:hypothetical protein